MARSPLTWEFVVIGRANGMFLSTLLECDCFWTRFLRARFIKEMD